MIPMGGELDILEWGDWGCQWGRVEGIPKFEIAQTTPH